MPSDLLHVLADGFHNGQNCLSVILLTSLICLISISGAAAQGCSDAGVCSIHGIAPVVSGDTARTQRNIVGAGVIFGMSQHNVVVLTPYAEYTRLFGKGLSLSGKFNYGFRSGELGSVHAPSDLLFSLSYDFPRRFTLTAGIKIPLNEADLASGGKSLPMNYQTSLGTVDILFGLGYRAGRFSFSAGYQQPVTQNGNQFLASDYPEGSPESKYYSTRHYHRAADVMARVSFSALDSRSWTLVAGLLPIYHVANDTYENPAGERVVLEGSQGITLNVNVVVKFRLTKSQYLELTIGAPVVARETRPDGLSQFAAGLTYGIGF